MDEQQNVVDASNRYMFSQSTLKFLQNQFTQNVTHLDLSSNHIDENCANLIASNLRDPQFSLTSLSVIQCHMNHNSTKIIFDAIASSKLYEFYVDDNLLDIECCRTLSHSISENPPLQLLSLVGCQIDDLSSIELFEGFKQNTNIKHLRIDSNTIYDKGAIALGNLFPNLQLESLCISDNQIWQEGTNYLLEKLRGCQTLTMLDIGYNIIDIQNLITFLNSAPNLVQLSISGCKVNEAFLDELLLILCGKPLTTLLIDALNFNQLPISWESVREITWSTHLKSLIELIKANRFLDDVRIGFLSPESISELKQSLNGIEKTVTISLHDFGYTRNTWLLHIPQFELESPTDVFEWKSPVLSGALLAEVFNISKFNGHHLRKINFHDMKFGDDVIQQFLQHLDPGEFLEMNLSNNDLHSTTIDFLLKFLEKGAYIHNINLDRNRFNLLSFQSYFEFLVNDIDKCPRSIDITFESKEIQEMTLHLFAILIGTLLEQNCHLENLHIEGSITCSDVNHIIQHLRGNTTLRRVEFESSLFQKYKSPDPPLDEEVKKVCGEMVRELYELLCGDGTECVLESFVFPMLTEIYLYSDGIIENWPAITNKLLENEDNNAKNV
ncbi:leucine-rich repeat-containing protein 74A [Histomonas meleagridis]|uniref:leucine-rich repeat-containing protein 74A n=1 Tax=Histomonas meleagridis TaxID=135588 RepID=UPI00355A7E69|nr:leucine-rich repeat-containing protein 74A [Histomonas meleagridis]KAH0800124.1 leucine-rich repeat-containing protein 74A [Histomonas meleagridis]